MHESQLKRTFMVHLLTILVMVTLLTSCLTTQEPLAETESNNSNSTDNQFEPKEQDLTDKELADIALWNSSEENIFVQNHLVPSDDNSSRTYNPWLASYEGFRMLSLLGLDQDMSTEEILLFIDAMFNDMPTEVEVGSLVKSIVIKGWYANGSPLVINITRAFSNMKNPVAVYMFNTRDNIRNKTLPVMKNSGIGFEYPRLITPDGSYKQEFMSSYMITWLDDGFVTASNNIGKDLKQFSNMSEDFDKLGLTDDWLRDGDLSNDLEVFNVVSEIILRDDINSIGKVYARLQLFMYHLFHEDVGAAQTLINELNESGLLDLPEVSESEIGIIAKRDLQRILDVAVRLSNQ